MMMLFVAAATLEPPSEGKGPSKVDFQFAQAGFVHSVAGDGMVHCSRFAGYKAFLTTDPDVYRVRYREYRARGPWKRLEATVRRDGDQWVWLKGDKPSCSITKFEN